MKPAARLVRLLVKFGSNTASRLGEIVAKEIHLFHAIGVGGEDSAAVRAYIVEHDLKEGIEFHNVMYEGSKALLRELSGQDSAPCLVADGMVVIGKDQIIKSLEKMLT